jgi:hypothetical protein
MDPEAGPSPHLDPSDLRPAKDGPGAASGLATGLQPSGMLPGGGQSGLAGRQGTGGASTAGKESGGEAPATQR